MNPSPILFIIFNRPDTTAIVFDEIRKYKPNKLYIAADGPRLQNKNDDIECTNTRQIIKQIDWPCETKTLFHMQNLGCGLAVSSALHWFFEHEEMGIILEDDCVPKPEFFEFCNELLHKYKNDDRVSIVSGTAIESSTGLFDESYAFSCFSLIWGWASWRRTWKNYNLTISEENQGLLLERILSLFPESYQRNHWTNILFQLRLNKIDTWDYQFLFHNWINNRISIVPQKSLVENIGFDERATHTKKRLISKRSDTRKNIIFPLLHPQQIHRCDVLDYKYMLQYKPNLKLRFKVFLLQLYKSLLSCFI